MVVGPFVLRPTSRIVGVSTLVPRGLAGRAVAGASSGCLCGAGNADFVCPLEGEVLAVFVRAAGPPHWEEHLVADVHTDMWVGAL